MVIYIEIPEKLKNQDSKSLNGYHICFTTNYKLQLMSKIFEIEIHIMGDVSPTLTQVLYSQESNDYELNFINEIENPKVTFSEDGKLVQTAGTPLDSNTLHHISEELKKTTNR